MELTQIKKAFETLKKQAASDAAEVELSYTQSESFSTGYQKGNLNKYSSNDSRSATVRVVQGKSEGFASTENLSEEALLQTYQEALQSAKDLAAGKKDEDTPTLLGPSEVKEMKGLLNLDFETVPTEEKLAMAKALEQEALSFDKRIQGVPYSGYGESKSVMMLMNSKGLDLSYSASGVSVYSYALAKEGEDMKDSGDSKFSRQIKKIDAKEIAKIAAEKALALLGAEQPKTGTYAVVFSSEVASHLIDALIDHASAKALHQDMSLLKGKLGQKLFSEHIDIEDDPFREELPGARPFDSEGAASKRTKVIENGVFKSFLTNTFYARKLNLPHTANAARGGGEMGVGPSNVILRKGKTSLEKLLQSHDEIIYISEISGGLHSGLKHSTLDFSLPAVGFLYKQGNRVKPVHQFVMSGNILEILKNVEDVSDRVNEDGSSVVSPDLLVSKVSIAGAN